MDYGLWIMDYGLWILDFGFWILDFGFWIEEKPWRKCWMFNFGWKQSKIQNS
jgi:hypothetical protein